MKLKKILALIAAGAMAATAMVTTAFAKETVLFEGEQDWASWKNMFSYPAATVNSWTDFTTDTVVTVNFKAAPANAQIKIATTGGKKYVSVYEAAGVKTDQIDIEVGATEIKYSLGEDDLALAKASGGLLMGGQNLVITKISYDIPGSSVDPGGDSSDSDPDPQPTDLKGIAFIGDSICAGNDWAKSFGRDDIVNLGVGGKTSTQVLEEQFPKLYTEYDGFEAVFIICGVNDWNLDGFGSTTTYENSMKNFKKMFELAKEKMPDAKIYVTGPFPVLGSQAHNMTNGALPGYHAKLEEVCADYDNVTFLGECWDVLYDGTTKLGKADLYNDDGLHINAAGYEAVCAIMKPYIDEIEIGKVTPGGDSSDSEDSVNSVDSDDSIIDSDSDSVADPSSDDSKGGGSKPGYYDKVPQTGIAITFGGFALAGAVVLLSKKRK